MDKRADKKDSFKYYGPNNLYQYWHDDNNKDGPAQRLGRDTWIHWTWGNQKVLRHASVLAGNLPAPVSIDFFRLLDSRNRGTRFRDLGLINEPNCGRSNPKDPTEPDYDPTILGKYGLYIDKWNGDPLGYYPADYDLDSGSPKDQYAAKDRPDYPPGQGPKDYLRHYGRPTGIVGLRLFRNNCFNKDKWDLNEYFKNPGKVEPPYLVGFSCAFCHIAFDPKNPPKDPEAPRWENLAANIGNQYFREGELFVGRGRITFGDKNPDPRAPDDPWRTRGLGVSDFLKHYAATQQPGTSETSRFSYDFINNPNTITPIWGIAYRPRFTEHTPFGRKRDDVWHALKDGSDAAGPEWALMRVPLNIGCEGDYWIDQLFNPATGRRQRPVRIAELLAGLSPKEKEGVEASAGFKFKDVPAERLRELEALYHSPWGDKPVGYDWQEAWRRVPMLKAYLLSYYWPTWARQAPGGAPSGQDEVARAKAAARRGAKVFGENCAWCHTNRPPLPDTRDPDKLLDFFRESAQAPNFAHLNFFADEKRYPVYLPLGERPKKGEPGPLKTNLGRAMATNAVHGDIWAEFSSPEYKALTPLAPVTLTVPVFPQVEGLPWELQRPLTVRFEPPAGGRGYYRTPSLISVWATAPYLHNNSVGDYYVYTTDAGGNRTYFWLSTDGSQWRAKNTDRWQARDPALVDYRIDPSVDGRLKMFDDGMRKLLNPARRHNWVKRTSAASALVPDLHGSVKQLLASVAHDVIVGQVRDILKQRNVPPAQIEELAQIVDGAIRRTIAEAQKDTDASVRFAWAALHIRARDQADRLFDLLFDDLRAELAENKKLPVGALDRLRLPLRGEFLARIDKLDERLREAALLKIPKGTPVNLYANLNTGAVGYAALAHLRHRNDPRALAQALLELSDCPDLVEDSGHEYGADLTDAEKDDLIEFLKTL
jgi:hypothetical protein